MTKKLIIFILLLTGDYVTGQTFTAIPTNIENNGQSLVSCGDYDNDGDLDVLVGGNSYTRIYRNNGNGVFTDINAGFPSLSWPASDWGDYDNDGDIDLVLAGKLNDSTYMSLICRNDNGIFNDIQADLPGLSRGTADWGDFDNDGDLDILLCGENEELDPVTIICRNEGKDKFSEEQGWLPGISKGSARWGDYDNDHDLDVLVCGRDINGNSTSAIYRNDGNRFNDIRAGLQTVQESAGIWGDYDSDGDLDIFICGYSYSKIYQNTDDGFTDIGADIYGLEYSKANWGDFDNDGYLDLIVVGIYPEAYPGITKRTAIYKYTPAVGFDLYDTTLIWITDGDAKWLDYDQDNDLDVIIAGYTEPWLDTAKVYRNSILKKNDWPSAPENLSVSIEGSAVIFSWDKSSDKETPMNGISYNLRVGTTPGGIEIVSPMSNLSDGRRRIVNFGNASSDTSWVIKNMVPGKYYWSVQAIDKGYLASYFAEERSFVIPEPYTDIEANLEALFRSSLAWGDYDNDRDMDLALCGCKKWKTTPPVKCLEAIAKIYQNEGDFNFTEAFVSPLGVYHGDLDWGDFDNDGDLDLLMTGEKYFTADERDTTITLIYQNLGNDKFEPLDPGIKGVCNGSGIWGDFDNDGDLDILLTGCNHQYGNQSVIYRNDRNNQFTETQLELMKCNNCYTTYGDADNDNDNDILHLCYGVRLYNNIENMSYEDSGLDLSNAQYGCAIFGDYDNDHDMDIFITGRDTIVYSKLLNNDGGIFNEVQTDFRGTLYGAADWGDFNIDGNLDLLLTGQSGRKISLVYRNDGNHLFTEVDQGLVGITSGDAEWSDCDNDGDLDIAITGNSDIGFISKVFKNNGNWPNQPPETPVNLKYEIKALDVLLKWDHCKDGDGKGGVTYNVRIDTIPGAGRITSAMSDMNTGYRFLPAPGNAGVNNSYLIKSLSKGKYYWSVQAIDHTYKGGLWSEEMSFELGNVYVDFENDTVCYGNPTTFTDLSQLRDGSILSWHWDFGDGGISNEQHPMYFFSQPGEVNVTLTIGLSTGTFHITKQVIVRSVPDVQFTYEPVSEGGEVMSFENLTDTSGINIVEWKWDFGDSTEFIGKNPSQHGYLNTGIYTVHLSAMSSDGCYNIVSEDIQVCQGMLKKPEINAYGPNTWYLVCSNDTARYYKWYYNGNQIFNAGSYIYVANNNMGEYKVAISSDDECYVESDMVLIPVTEVSAFDSYESVSVYPNPSDGHFGIYTLIEDINLYNYRLIDIFGKEIASGKMKSENNESILFDFHHLKDGIYIIEIHKDYSRICLKKLIIKK